MREPIELSVGMVSGVGGGMGVLDGVYVPEGMTSFGGLSTPLVSIEYFLTKMYSTRA